MAEAKSTQPSIEAQHHAEVASGQRFEFGKNWSRFLKNLNEERIALAQKSLQSSLNVDRLDGLTFLDVGSGSGLFSLVARRLGAKVRSFDYDTHSVACTRELRRRYFPNDPDWSVEQGSVLDRAFIGSLGRFDIVYSWGVLHHTGAMHEALANVKPLVPMGGRLFIAIYNDQGAATDQWADIKKTYNHLSWPLSLLYALKIIAKEEWRAIREQLRRRDLMPWVRTWTEYAKLSTRGMSRWHDWIDWVGGYPYERATVEKIVDIYAEDGFKLETLIDRSNGYGCNEFVFRRIGQAGEYVDSRLSGGNAMARRLGYRITDISIEGHGVFGRASFPAGLPWGGPFQVITDERLVGLADPTEDGRLSLSLSGIDTHRLTTERLYAVPARLHPILGPFRNPRGLMWEIDLPQYSSIADHEGASRQSTLFVFENGVQLPIPHATHDDIDQYGRGRFSHWNFNLYLSTLNGDDPNVNGKEYLAVIALPISAMGEDPAAR